MAEKISTIEDLAALIQRTMASKEDIASLDVKIEGLRSEMRDGFVNVHSRLDFIREEISDLPSLREDIRYLRGRVK